jgi:hypothetical protein
MMGWRLMVAGLMTCAVVAAQPVSARDAVQEQGATSDDVAAFDDGAGSSDTWSMVGWGALTGLSNLVYIPAKLAYAVLGGVTGGLALGLTGGDVDTATGIWKPSLGGDYFLTPGMIQGEESFSFAGAPAGSFDDGTMPDDAPPAPAPGDRRFGS